MICLDQTPTDNCLKQIQGQIIHALYREERENEADRRSESGTSANGKQARREAIRIGTRRYVARKRYGLIVNRKREGGVGPDGVSINRLFSEKLS